MGYDWNFSILANPVYLGALAKGLLVTLQLSAICILIGTPLGVAIGCLPAATRGFGFDAVLRSHSRTRLQGLLRKVSRILADAVVFLFIDVIRAIPLLLLMLTCYYALPYISPELAGSFHWTGAAPVSPFASAAVAMSINLAAFVADLVRAAFTGVSRGSILAGLAVGMDRSLVIRRVVLPEVLREIWPGLVLLYITMLKMSTLASALTVWELLHSAESLIQSTYRTLELYLAVCVVFVAMIVPISIFARRLERSEALRRRS
jgi:polar amino acid transport system permease protein